MSESSYEIAEGSIYGESISVGSNYAGSAASTMDESMDEGELLYWGQPSFGPVENVEVATEIQRYPHEVRHLETALSLGDREVGRLSLPLNIVKKILDESEYYCAVEKKAQNGFQGEDMNECLFKFGPLPTKPYKVEIEVVSHDQGWSSYPQDRNTKNNSWTWGEVDVKNATGESKLKARTPVFTNLHAVKRWQTHSLRFQEHDSFMKFLERGDTLEMYFRAQFPGWVIFVREARMNVYYEPPVLQAH